MPIMPTLVHAILFDTKWLPEPMWTYLICLWEIFKLISVIDDWNVFHDIVLRCLSLDFIGDKLILIQAMAWCHQTTGNYMLGNIDPDLCHHMASLGYSELTIMMSPGIHIWPYCILTIEIMKSCLKIAYHKQLFHSFFYYGFTYILMPHNMMTLYFNLPYFHVSNSALFFTWYVGTLILEKNNLDTFYIGMKQPWIYFY